MISNKNRIISPMPTGNGAYLLHKMIEAGIGNYRVCGYHPNVTLMPPLLALIARNKRASAIHTTPDHALFFHRKNIPLILTVHHTVLDQYIKRYSTFPQRIHYKTDLLGFTKISLRMATTVTAVSRFTAEMLREELGYQPPVRVIYNGIDTEKYIPSTESPHTGIRVLFSGNRTNRKGFQWLPAIAERLKKGISIHYTQGLRRKQVQVHSENLKGLGEIQSNDMPSIYRTHDILLSPTVREGFGLAVAEAMACGLPVVASDCSSIPELVDHGKGGFLCRVGDVNDFAEKINTLADAPRLRREMGEYNRAKVEKMFTLERMIREYMTLFEEVLDRRKDRIL